MDEKLITNVADYIYSYIENFEEVNFDFFVTQISNVIIDALDLRVYVNDFKINESYDKNSSSRGFVDKKGNVCIFREGIEKSLDEMLQDVPNLSEYEINLLRCLLYVKTVMHELEHINQKKF